VFRLLPILLVCGCGYADSIAVEITPDRHALVREHYGMREHYSLSGPVEFVFLASTCARLERIQSGDGHALETQGSGPWITVPVSSTTPMDLSYEVVPLSPSLRTCAVPIVMPKRAVDSVSMTVTDRGSGLSRVSVPHLIAHPDLRTWTATFSAVPSHVQLEWETGEAPPAPVAGPTGSFSWNFWGLVGVLVTWTVAYLIWARRQAL
jgi:hypothetical protein